MEQAHTTSLTEERPAGRTVAVKPRVAFLGTGWIGHHRMKSLAEAGTAQIVAAADQDPAGLDRSRGIAPGCHTCNSLDELMALEPDGIVIATPNALHAEQAIAALERGIAVFCQKPLGRTETEAQAVIAAARRADRLLQVDYSYRYTTGLRSIRDMVQAGMLGRVFAAELEFHNAYGPDKAWYYDRALSGGGCLTDLGVHLVDTALWCLGFPAIMSVDGCLYREGRQLPPNAEEGEDYAWGQMRLEDGREVRIGCSWRAHAGQEARITARFWGTSGAALWENVDGSFYDFRTWHFQGTDSRLLASPREDWGGGGICEWGKRLAEDGGYDPAIEETAKIARVLDRIYGRR